MPIERSPTKTGLSLDPENLGEDEDSLEEADSVRQLPTLNIPRSADVHAAEFRNVRIATFWRNRPKLWFAHLESEFTAFRVRSDDVKYSSVIRHLDEQTMLAVADILEQPPAQVKYETLKSALVKRFSVSQEKQLRTLLGAMELGSKTPSTLLREMRTLAGRDATDTMLRTLWTQRLPQRIQELLVVLEDVNLDKLAACADKAMERYFEPTIAAVKSETPVDILAELTEKCRKLELEVAEFRRRPREARTNRTRSRSSSRYRRSDGKTEGYCFYHRRFGAKSWRCVLPCKAPYLLATQGNANLRQQ